MRALLMHMFEIVATPVLTYVEMLGVNCGRYVRVRTCRRRFGLADAFLPFWPLFARPSRKQGEKGVMFGEYLQFRNIDGVSRRYVFGLRTF